MNSIHHEDIYLYFSPIFFCGLVVKKFCGYVSKLYSDAGKFIISGIIS